MNTDNLIDLRNELELTQEEMAKIIGVSRSTYTCYETAREKIPIEKLNIISNKYNVSLNFLTGLSRTNNSQFNHIDINYIEIGKTFKRLRKKLKMSQKELAKKLHISHSSISNYEHGRNITTELLIDYAKLTGKSIDYLCGKINAEDKIIKEIKT